MSYQKIKLIPDPSAIPTDQYVIIEPTGPDPGGGFGYTDVHVRSGGLIDSSTCNLVFGGEYNCIRLVDSLGRVSINSTERISFYNTYHREISPPPVGTNEIAIDHGQNVTNLVYSGLDVPNTSTVDIDLFDGYYDERNTIAYNQFSTLKCFFNIRYANGNAEAFDYVVVSSGGVAVGNTFNRVGIGTTSLVTVGCVFEPNDESISRLVLELTNNSGGNIDFVSNIVAIRSNISGSFA
jgi:hypothetical protein